MAKVKVSHPGFTSDDAKEPPAREPVPAGIYTALIASVGVGATKGQPPLQKISTEFSVLKFHGEDGKGPESDTASGRRVYQDYVLEHDAGNPSISELRRYELRMILEACDVNFDDEGFDPEELVGKTVKIQVSHRKGRQMNDDGTYPLFTNVSKVDTAEDVDPSDLV